MYQINYNRTEEELRNERVTVQVTIAEKRKLKEIARQNGMTVSQLIRIICIYNPIEQFTGGRING